MTDVKQMTDDEFNRHLADIVRPTVDSMLESNRFDVDDNFDPLCPKCKKVIDGCYGGCLACDLADDLA